MALEHKDSLFAPDSPPEAVEKVRRGPPNRMNDLPYREWMKFQKSFFRHDSDQRLVDECVSFFTKAVWPDGRTSRTLLIGFPGVETNDYNGRMVEHTPGVASFAAVKAGLERESAELCDFVFVDLRESLNDEADLDQFLADWADVVFCLTRKALIDDRYCGFVVPASRQDGRGFPLAWSVAQAARSHLRLRDEKIGLIEEDGRIFYCLFFQASDDGRPSKCNTSSKISVATVDQDVPSWVIPRPPPRRPNEILHPAKYPETLVEEFIRLFTQPGDSVFDPMLGTGSTAVAAIRANRNGYGVELSQEFADIARSRVESSIAESGSLFSDDAAVNGQVFLGDATKLDSIPEMLDLKFDYAITSPPYWSMLTNPGSENQRKRRDSGLRLTYSDAESDVGNIQEYDQFIDVLENVYAGVAAHLKSGGVLTVVVKNVKREHILYTLAWDLTERLASATAQYEYIGNTFWCQDDVGLKPFAVGIHWVSNILHQYCLHFRRK